MVSTNPRVSLGLYSYGLLIGGITTPHSRIYPLKNTELSFIKINMAKIVNPNAAGIDISSKDFYVAIDQERIAGVKVFESFTSDIHNLAKYLKDNQVTTVAMESTGVYWFHLYTVLEEYGIETKLVNARHIKYVPGRKSDVQDAQWLQELHMHGMLNGSFQPENTIRELRNYVRLRKQIIQELSKETQRMQKALEMMNIKLTNVIRDITGKTGFAIIDSIISGERSPQELVKLRDRRIKCTPEILEKSLTGNWREEQLFNLEFSRNRYRHYQEELELVDQQTEMLIATLTEQNKDQETRKIKKHRKQKNSPTFNVSEYLQLIHGVDVTAIPGFKENVALTVFSETGVSLQSNFETEKQFLSWANLVPNNKITGGKVISSRMQKTKNAVGQAFRDAANSLWKNKGPLGDYLRRKKAKSGGKAAIISTARKIASIYYKMVTEQIEFDINKLIQNRDQYIQRKLIYLQNKVKSLEIQINNNEGFTKSVI